MSRFLHQVCRSLALPAIIGILCALPGCGATIFSNLGPGDSFAPSGVGIGFTPANVFTYAGIGFTPIAQTYSLDGVDVPIKLISGPNALDLFITSDAGGIPGSILESFHLTNALPSGADALVHINSIAHPTLLPGMQYWVVAAGGSPVTFASWNQNSVNNTGANVSGSVLNSLTRNSDANVREALRVSGTAIPEPQSWMLAGTALLGCLGLSCLRRT